MWSFQSWQEGIKDIYRVHKQKHKIKSDEVLYKYEKLELFLFLSAKRSPVNFVSLMLMIIIFVQKSGFY